MDKSIGKLTVYFDDPFWVGVFERIEDEKLSVCKITFRTEPKDYEILEFVLKYYSQLKFSPPVDVTVRKETTNPKRIQRKARKQTVECGIGTKSQQALQLQRSEHKLMRKTISKEKRKAEKQRKYDLKQQKRKKKHRGR